MWYPTKAPKYAWYICSTLDLCGDLSALLKETQQSTGGSDDTRASCIHCTTSRADFFTCSCDTADVQFPLDQHRLFLRQKKTYEVLLNIMKGKMPTTEYAQQFFNNLLANPRTNEHSKPTKGAEEFKRCYRGEKRLNAAATEYLQLTVSRICGDIKADPPWFTYGSQHPEFPPGRKASGRSGRAPAWQSSPPGLPLRW